MIKNKNQLFFNNSNETLLIKNNINNKKSLAKKSKIENKKIKIVGNFFKLKFLNKKKLIKFNLCLAHKIYILKNKKKSYLTIKKIKKNKIIILQKKNIKNSQKNTKLSICTENLKKKKRTKCIHKKRHKNIRKKL